jgi:GcrA cell cycle regulator
MTDIIWTPKRVENLKAWWAAGASASEISRLMDLIVSRSAVIGKVHRLGIQRGAMTRHSPKKPANAKTATKPAPGGFCRPVAFPGRFTAYVSDVDPVAIVDEPAPAGQRKTIETLTSTCCRWPVGDPGTPDFHFCGATRLPGLPYCQPHAKRAYTPVMFQQRAKDRAVATMREKVGAE